MSRVRLAASQSQAIAGAFHVVLPAGVRGIVGRLPSNRFGQVGFRLGGIDLVHGDRAVSEQRHHSPFDLHESTINEVALASLVAVVTQFPHAESSHGG